MKHSSDDKEQAVITVSDWYQKPMKNDGHRWQKTAVNALKLQVF